MGQSLFSGIEIPYSSSLLFMTMEIGTNKPVGQLYWAIKLIQSLMY